MAGLADKREKGNIRGQYFTLRRILEKISIFYDLEDPIPGNFGVNLVSDYHFF